MKTIGMIGGMSWESTVTYYKIINQVTKEALGGLHSAQCLLYSVDFYDIAECQSAGDWTRSADMLAKVAQGLEKAGANFIIICTNTMHKVADDIQRRISVPILHIAEVTADVLLNQGLKKVALLGTKYTMEEDFYKQKLIDRGLDVIVPDKKGRELINHTIYHELCLGEIKETSKRDFINIMNQLGQLGAQGIILGCTEIGLLVQQEDIKIPLFDTTVIHATKAAELAINMI
ncbi:MAG: aspartate/glutamate racemase family protein [Herbinix sp.]|jgi:aspartate racemase|nr:aspartate/glutamate racemase family protein [Herbinix sp.]